MSQKKQKKKCQPTVRDTPGLLQGPHPPAVGVGVPDGGLARHKKVNKCAKLKMKMFVYKSVKKFEKSTILETESVKVVKNSYIKTKKCQPTVRDTPGTLQGPHPPAVGVGVPDGGLARPTKKYLNKKYHEKAGLKSKMKISPQAVKHEKTKKCQPTVRDTPGTLQGPHPPAVGVGVPDGGLARPKKIETVPKRSPVVLKKGKNDKIKKCQPAVRDTPGLLQGPHPPAVGVGVPDGGLACPKNIKKTTSRKKHSNLILSICLSLLLNVVLLHAWKTTLAKVGGQVDTLLPENWPWLNDYWKGGDSSHCKGDIIHIMSQKKMNKLQRSVNGNRSMHLKVIHWNLGARLWQNKLDDIQLLLDDLKPDLCFISEANLWEGLESHQLELQGHKLVLPNTMATLQHAIIVLIVKDTITVTKLDQFMGDQSATIWVRIGEEGRNSLRIAGIYREHHILGEDNQNMTWQVSQQRQEDRWRDILVKWRTASRNKNCLVVGDLNLDFIKWNNPELHQQQMINWTQQQIEAVGFVQIVVKLTRAWQYQSDSLLDHVWINCPGRLSSHINVLRTLSDHNVVGANISLREIKTGGHNVTRRKWKYFKESRYILKLQNIDWTDLYLENNIDVANTLFENKLGDVLDSGAPMATIQQRTHYSSWLDVRTKACMLERDLAREVARLSQQPSDWDKYRRLKNLVTKMQRSDKTTHYRDLYNKVEEENDTENLFGITKKLLGWKMSTPPSSLYLKVVQSGLSRVLPMPKHSIMMRKLRG